MPVLYERGKQANDTAEEPKPVMMKDEESKTISVG